MSAAITLITTITSSEVWVPFIVRAKMSRPISSWPNGCRPMANPSPPSQVGMLSVGDPPFTILPGV